MSWSVQYREPRPIESVDLIAAPFTLHATCADGVAVLTSSRDDVPFSTPKSMTATSLDLRFWCEHVIKMIDGSDG